MARSLGLLLLCCSMVAGFAAAQEYGAAELSTCKAVIKLLPELKAGKNDGYTIFCPTNDAFDYMAQEIGFEDTPKTKTAAAKSAATQLLEKVAADPNLRAIIGFHVVKGVYPVAAFKDGATVTLKTLAGAPLKVGRDATDLTVTSTLLDLADPDSDDDAFSDDVAATDLTFEGPFSAKKGSKYVVHAVERVLTPKGPAAAALRKLYASINA